MAGEKINIQENGPRILVAPLDWGLGHATRIIPLVKILEAGGATVLLAGDGATSKLLQTELPGREILKLPGYNIRYSKSNKTFFFKLLLQVPALLGIVKKEQRWLKNTIEEKRIDAVISDNRFGFYSRLIPSVYISHQLYIETGLPGMANNIAQKIHYKYIKNFSECWVPDFENNGIAGKLSHPAAMPAIPVKYVGPLSRFQKEEFAAEENKILIILSGPEPQRTLWENNLLEQLKIYKGNAVLVRGLPLVNTAEKEEKSSLKIHNYLSSSALAAEIKKASLIICRSGYSTIMDLVAMQKKAIIVPTPAQGEQEYLGKYLMKQKRFYSCSQGSFNLNEVIKAAEKFPFEIQPANFSELNNKVVLEWLENVRQITSRQ